MKQDQSDILSIKNHCTKIRNAFVAVKAQSALFKDFPQGCCRDASIVIGLYLKEKGFSDSLYCSKEFSQTFPSHSWIEYKGFIIDVTAEQFDHEFTEVLIMPTNEAGSYHQKDREEICSVAIAGMDSINLLSDYALIKNSMAKD